MCTPNNNTRANTACSVRLTLGIVKRQCAYLVGQLRRVRAMGQVWHAVGHLV